MARFIVAMLCHNNEHMIADALEAYMKTTSPSQRSRLEGYCYHCDYPGLDIHRLQKLASSVGFAVIAGPNRGVLGNYNIVASMTGLEQDDIVLWFDPDSRPQQPNWAPDIVSVFHDVKDCGYIHWNQDWVSQVPRQPEHITTDSGVVLQQWYTKAWSMGAMHGRWLRHSHLIGKKAFYGDTETVVTEAMQKMGMKPYMLLHHMDLHVTKQEHSLMKWKLKAGKGMTELTYAEWLIEST
jgi:hypothetical protein